MTQLRLTVEDVTVVRGRNNILRDIDFECLQGVVGLAGRNGSGKTTLLNVCSGYTKPTFGFSELTGLSDGEANRELVGFLPQVFDYPKNLTILDFLRYVAWLRFGKAASPNLALDALASVGIEPHGNTRMGRASGG